MCTLPSATASLVSVSTVMLSAVIVASPYRAKTPLVAIIVWAPTNITMPVWFKPGRTWFNAWTSTCSSSAATFNENKAPNKIRRRMKGNLLIKRGQLNRKPRGLSRVEGRRSRAKVAPRPSTLDLRPSTHLVFRQKRKAHRRQDADEGGDVVPSDLFAQIKHGEPTKNHQGDYLLDDLQLGRRIDRIAPAICRDHQNILEKGNAPAGQDHQQQRFVLVLQMPIPREGHEDVRRHQQQDRKPTGLQQFIHGRRR